MRGTCARVCGVQVSKVILHECNREMVQWNPSNPDTLEPQKVSGVEKYTNVAFGIAKTVLYIEVSLFQSVLIEGFHCKTEGKQHLNDYTTIWRLRWSINGLAHREDS